MRNSRRAFLAISIFAVAVLGQLYRSFGTPWSEMKYHHGNSSITSFAAVGVRSKVSMNTSLNAKGGYFKSLVTPFIRSLLKFWYRERVDKSQKSPVENATQQINDLQKLSTEVWTKIWKRQNPENCDKTQLLVYDILSWRCGFGCTLHVTLMHFLLAFYANRTFVLKSRGWSYDKEGWDHYHMPLGKCDYNGTIKSLPVLSGNTSDVRVVRSVHRGPYRRYDWKIPRNILGKLKSIHSDPYAWWIGQFVSYMVRFQPWLVEVLKNKAHVTNSTVGLHIRWGDKLKREALKHPVSQYMDFASKWFERPENRGQNKTVYVATEESSAWKNLDDSFSNFSFYGSGYVNRNRELDYKKGTGYANRPNELDAIVADIYFLSKCPYIVCTFSSNICRLLFEMMSIHKRNPRNSFQSLDSTYYWLMGFPKCRGTADHDGSGDKRDVDLKIGDTFEIARYVSLNKRNGFAYGTNTRTGQKGQVPINKLEIIVQPLDFDM